MLKDLLSDQTLADFVPHGTCLLWRSDLLLLHSLSDGLIAAACYSIPAALIYFVAKRRDLRFRWMFVLFGAFLLACGTTHVMGIWTLWHPDYVLEGYIKLFTAVVAVSTAVLLWPLLPHALALPGPVELEETNRRLQREIEERKAMEQRVRQLNGQLERRVRQRTAELLGTNRQLKEEIRERRRIEASLRESEQRLQQSQKRLEHILNTSPSPIYILEETGHPEAPFRVSFIGTSIVTITGYPPADWYGKDTFWIDHVHPDDRARVLANQKILLNENELTHQYRFRHRDGSYRWVHDQIHLERDHAGGIVEVIGAWIDITERQRAELAIEEAKEAAEAANRAKTEFLANISHELRTPLNAILGFTQILQREPEVSPRHRDFLESIRRSGTHLVTLIDDLLDLSKIESGKLEITRSIFGLDEFLGGVAEMFDLRARQKGLGFRFEKTDPFADFVFGDEKRLRQILINLLGNAVKFTSSGQVLLRVSHRDDIACFEIEDTGPGIAPEDLERIFSPFERLDYHASGEGSGLGLAISKRLVESMQGTLEVHSELGRGSLFRITLPLPKAAKPSLRKLPKRAISGYQGESRRILLVDDNPDNLEILSIALESVGFVTASAMSGREALQQFETFAPHLTMIDLVMPGMDGIETVRRLRTSERGRAIKAVAVTANAFEDTRQLCLAAGFDDFIAKPVELDDLFDLIQTQLGLRWNYAGEGD